MASENNKRIAKNTLMLYIRMGVSMLVSLYTSRIVLATLGVDDYGIISIVGGVVTMFAFLNGALSTSTSRFLTIELGRKDDKQLNKVFSAAFVSHLILALFVLLLCETVGLWFLINKLVIPNERIIAAHWVYQLSTLSTVIGIVQVPYGAVIIAREKMNIYAYMSIFDVVIKLVLIFLLQWFSGDKLIFWSFILFVVSLVYFVFYVCYCLNKFSESHVRIHRDKVLYKRLFSFSGWSLFGSIANISAQQGLNILLNIFRGVTLNAAMGITNQVTGAINGFVINFQTAFNPQIIKSYAEGDKTYFLQLVFRTSKFSYFLLFVLAFPFILNIDYILAIWLETVPEHANSFIQLMLVFLLIDALSAPLWISVQAIGDIRNYQLLMSLMIILNFPIAYLILKNGLPPHIVFVVRVIINAVTHFVRIVYLRKKINFPAYKYLREVMLTVLLITLMSIPIPYWVFHQFIGSNALVISSVVSIFISLNTIYWVGLSRQEKNFVINAFKNIFNHR